ncbi:MAG TPA: ABC transporter ATP-binding protein, partial [Ferruginibacter sp.]|nr:ABC transporter ATP-binding protein [Ferruginibacter sp.]
RVIKPHLSNTYLCPMPAIIEVNGLSKKFKDVTAVADLSFSVNEGDVYGFLGQNGAGKSTTIRMLLTLVQPTHGSISIFGKNLFTHSKSILKEVGAIIEKPDLYKYLSAYDNLAIFARMSGIKATKAFLMEQLHLVGLEERAESKVKTFSQGMKQRLGIAVALVHDPKLIVLDEPTNGLDPQGIADMRNLIIGLSRERGKTILVSSHLLSEIQLVANRMLIIHHGKKMVEGNAEELLDPSKSVISIETEDDVAARTVLQQSKWNAFLQPNSHELRFSMNKQDVPALINDLVQMNFKLHSINPMNSLEDFFLSLTTEPHHVEAGSN